ncbi:MAG: polysaccharide deacetylase family protein [Myxococcales bacterium]
MIADPAADRSRIEERRASAWGRPLLWGLALLAAAAAGAALAGVAVPHWTLAVSGGLLVGLVAAGVGWQPSGVFARPLLGVRTPWPELALTFDDGPNPEQTPALLDALEAHGHRATFFVVGSRAERHPELLREIVRRGHALANHSFFHSPLTTFRPPRRLEAELRRTGELLARAGAHPRFLRAPVGLLSPRVARAARGAGLDLVGWTASARDGAPWRTAEDGVRRLRPRLAPGAILVLHDGPRSGGRPPLALPIFEALVADLESRGLRSVTLERLLRL